MAVGVSLHEVHPAQRDSARRAVEQGWELQRKGNKLALVAPDGHATVVVLGRGKGGDHRSTRNTVAMLRRAGVTL